MKSMKRRLLSLFMAMVMVCSVTLFEFKVMPFTTTSAALTVAEPVALIVAIVSL